MLDEQRVKAYLERLEYDQPVNHDLATLDALTFAHQRHIPFETVTLRRRGHEPSLDADVIFEKVVTRGLGGYCFELNKLFEELLRALGFDARPVLSRAVRGRAGRMPINHRGIIAYADEGACSVDVGFGGPMPAGALVLSNGVEQTVRGEVFTPYKTDHAWWRIERVTRASHDFFDDAVPERRQIELELCTAPVEDIDFGSLNLFFSQPGTKFFDNDIVNLRTENGHYSYLNGELTLRENGEKQVLNTAPEEADAVYERYFGMKNIDAAIAAGL